jgi:hypothetical protein
VIFSGFPEWEKGKWDVNPQRSVKSRFEWFGVSSFQWILFQDGSYIGSVFDVEVAVVTVHLDSQFTKFRVEAHSSSDIIPLRSWMSITIVFPGVTITLPILGLFILFSVSMDPGDGTQISPVFSDLDVNGLHYRREFTATLYFVNSPWNRTGHPSGPL